MPQNPVCSLIYLNRSLYRTQNLINVLLHRNIKYKIKYKIQRNRQNFQVNSECSKIYILLTTTTQMDVKATCEHWTLILPTTLILLLFFFIISSWVISYNFMQSTVKQHKNACVHIRFMIHSATIKTPCFISYTFLFVFFFLPFLFAGQYGEVGKKLSKYIKFFFYIYVNEIIKYYNNISRFFCTFCWIYFNISFLFVAFLSSNIQYIGLWAIETKSIFGTTN